VLQDYGRHTCANCSLNPSEHALKHGVAAESWVVNDKNVGISYQLLCARHCKMIAGICGFFVMIYGSALHMQAACILLGFGKFDL